MNVRHCSRRFRRGRLVAGCTGAVLVAAAVLGLGGPPVAAAPSDRPDRSALSHFKHLVVIYEENHSFDNLFGGWGNVDGTDVDGIGGPRYDPHPPQISRTGSALNCLPQNDVNLTSPPLDSACGNVTLASNALVASHFPNAPFSINDYIAPDATTCPSSDDAAENGLANGTGAPGGCTRDMVHRFYQEQFQLHGGLMDRYALASDAMGLTQGYYDTSHLPIYDYLHSDGAPKYVVADHFFQGAFGGSFLNHQYLISSRAPVWTGWGTGNPLHSLLDANGMPDRSPLYRTTAIRDTPITQPCANTAVVFGERGGRACGDVAVNTVHPFSEPHAPGAADNRRLPAIDDTAYPNIGDRLNGAGVPWAWYAGGWDNAAGNTDGGGWTNGTTPGTCEDADHRTADVYPYCAG